MTKLLFPGVRLEDFDAAAPWLVSGFDTDGKAICFQGTGQNEGLQFTISYEESPDTYQRLFDNYVAEGKALRERMQKKGNQSQIRIQIYETFPLEYFLEPAREEELLSWEVF